MDELLPKALPVETEVAGDATDPKWDIPAQSAESYLKMVRQEAMKCPDIVIAADLDSNKINSLQNYFVADDGPRKAPPGFEPSIQWQCKQILEFSKTRDRISKMRGSFKKSRDNAPRFPPDMTDAQRWVVWSCGKTVLRDNSESPEADVDEGEDDDDDDDDDMESNRSSTDRSSVPKDGVSLLLNHLDETLTSTSSAFPNAAPTTTNSISAAEKLELKEGNLPLMSIVMYLTQPMVQTLLQHHLTFIIAKGFHIQQGPWIYSLLAVLQKPLTPDTCSTLRDLARLCAQLRSQLDSASHPHLTPLNLFISLIARYFDQKDMADGINPSV